MTGHATNVAVGGQQSHLTADATRPRLTRHRSTDPIDVLSRHLNDVCTRAVDPWQIAAALEADGMGDRVARDLYGKPDIFALADELYRRVPLRATQLNASEATEETPAWRDLSRGLLFVLPGALYIAAVRGFSSLESSYALLVTLIFAWVWGQGSGYLGHVLIGRKAFGTARRIVLSLAAAGVAVSASVSWLAVLIFGLSFEVVAVTVVQTIYLLAASALLLFRKEHVMFAVLLPGVAIASLITLGTTRFDDDLLAAAVVIATVAVVAVAAVVATRSEVDISPAELTRTDLRGAIPHMILGFLWALLVSFSALVTLDAADGAPSVAVTILPLLLSMGIAEWSLRRYLKLTRQALVDVADLEPFSIAARRIMWTTVGGYTLAVAALTGAAAAVLAALDELRAVDLLMLFSYGQLGAAFLLGQILASRSRLNQALVISVAAMVILITTATQIGGRFGSASLEIAYFVSTLFLAVALLVGASMAVGKSTTYR